MNNIICGTCHTNIPNLSPKILEHDCFWQPNTVQSLLTVSKTQAAITVLLDIPAQDRCGFTRFLWIAKYYSFALPPTWVQLQHLQKYITATIDHPKLLEVGAGCGLYGALWESLGWQVQATDASNNVGQRYHCCNSTAATIKYLPIETLNAEAAITKYSHYDILLLVWPEYCIPLESLATFQGTYIFLVGEEEGGCTSCGLEGYLDSNNGWYHIMTYFIPRWPGIRDSLKVYSRVQQPIIMYNQDCQETTYNQEYYSHY